MDEQGMKHDDDEIELIGLLRVLWRWKIFIVSVAALSIIIALIYLFFVPTVYKCSMTITPFILKEDGVPINQINQSIVDSTEISAVINSKGLTEKLMNNMNLSNKDLYKNKLSFKVSPVRKTQNINIAYYAYRPEQGIQVLNELINLLNEYFQPEIDSFIEQQQRQISFIDMEIKIYKNQMEIELIDKNAQIDSTETKISYFERIQVSTGKEIDKIEAWLKKIKEQKESIEKKYTALISQSNNILNYSAFLDLKLAGIQDLEYDLQMLLLEKQKTVTLNSLEYKDLINRKRNIQKVYQISKENNDLLISDLENKKILKQRDIQENKVAVEVIKTPVSLSNSVKPKKNFILLLSFASSLFISVFCVFLFEYCKNLKKTRK